MAERSAASRESHLRRNDTGTGIMVLPKFDSFCKIVSAPCLTSSRMKLLLCDANAAMHLVPHSNVMGAGWGDEANHVKQTRWDPSEP